MIKQTPISQDDFDKLLDWLSADREKAGEEYENIRRGLVRLFQIKGCANPQDLADKTINRVAAKLSRLDLSKNPKPIFIFHGFARNIYREEVSPAGRKEEQLKTETENDLEQQTRNLFSQADEYAARGRECLKDCFQNHEIYDRRLFVKYYCTKTSDRAQSRLDLAKEMNITLNSLQTKVYRMKLSLRDCIKNCLNENNL